MTVENPAEADETAEEPSPPPGLGGSGRRLWRGVTGRWVCDPDELAILEQACQVADEVALLRAQLVRSASVMVVGSRGQERVHPAVSALAEARRVFAYLMGRLRTPAAREQEQSPSSSSDAGRNLVAVRWEAKRGA